MIDRTSRRAWVEWAHLKGLTHAQLALVAPLPQPALCIVNVAGPAGRALADLLAQHLATRLQRKVFVEDMSEACAARAPLSRALRHFADGCTLLVAPDSPGDRPAGTGRIDPAGVRLVGRVPPLDELPVSAPSDPAEACALLAAPRAAEELQQPIEEVLATLRSLGHLPLASVLGFL